MKLYTEKQVKKLLTAQRANCYDAVLKLSHKNIANAATQAPIPGGDNSLFDEYHGIDPETLFKEDLEDKELHGNYDRFQKNRDDAKESYNKYVPKLNALSSKILDLKELIVALALYQTAPGKTIKKLKKLEIKFDDMQAEANKYYSVIEVQNALIKRYEDWNDRKLFIHWNYLTMLKVTKVPFMEWRSEYEGIII